MVPDDLEVAKRAEVGATGDVVSVPSRAVKRAVAILVMYAVFRVAAVPALGYFRLVGEFNTAMLSQYVNVATVALLILFGPKSLLQFRTWFHLVIIFVAVQAALLGLLGSGDSSLWNARDYLSHIFQLFTVLVMFNVGRFVAIHIPKSYWRRIAYLSVIGAGIGLLVSANGYLSGEFGRYTAAAPLFSLAYAAAIGAPFIGILSLIIIGFSAKRGSIVAAMSMMVAYLFSSSGQALRVGSRARKMLFIGLFLFLVGSIFTLGAAEVSTEDGGVGVVARQTSVRIQRVVDAMLSGDPESFDSASSGRLTEVNAALERLNPRTIVTGLGAGVSIDVSGGAGQTRQYTHFSPLGITLVYGCLFAIFVYAFVSRELVLAWKRQPQIGVATRLSMFYVLSSLVSSLFAFSLFVDLLMFMFVGLLYADNRRRIGQ